MPVATYEAVVAKPNGSQAEGFVALHSLPDVRAMDRRKALRNWLPIWKDAGDVQRVVGQLFSYQASDVRALDAVLFTQARADYGAAVAAEARAAGYSIASVNVTDQAVMTALNERSGFAAKSIATTYNKDVRQEIARIRAEVPKANRWTYAKRLDAWEKNRASWKAEQIAYTEMGTTIQQAKMDFMRQNHLEPNGRVVPDTAQCGYCEELAGMGWMSFAEIEGLGLPAHVGCIHSAEFSYEGMTMPGIGDLWLGGEGAEGWVPYEPMTPADYMLTAKPGDTAAARGATRQTCQWLKERYEARGFKVWWNGKIGDPGGGALGSAGFDGTIGIDARQRQELLKMMKTIGRGEELTASEMRALQTVTHEMTHMMTLGRSESLYQEGFGRILEEGLTEAYSNRITPTLAAEMAGRELPAEIVAMKPTPLYAKYVQFVEAAARQAGAVGEAGITEQIDQWKKATYQGGQFDTMLKAVTRAQPGRVEQVEAAFKQLYSQDTLGGANRAAQGLARLSKEAADEGAEWLWTVRQGALLDSMTAENADQAIEQAEAMVTKAPTELKEGLARGLEAFYMLRSAYVAAPPESSGLPSGLAEGLPEGLEEAE